MRCLAEEIQVCQYCFQSNNLILIPNDLPGFEENELYCSKACKEKAVKIYNLEKFRLREMDDVQRSLYEALDMCEGSYKKLEQLLDDPELAKKTIFDFKWKNMEEKQRKFLSLVAINGLVGSPEGSRFKEQDKCSHVLLDSLNDKEHKRIAMRFMQRLKIISTLNAIGLDGHAFDIENPEKKLEIFETKSAGTGILIFGSLLNHSCDHNVNRMTVGSKVVFYANRSIAKGEQLFVNYG